MPADHTSKREAMQKKVIDCPISNHEPVSVTLKKNVMVMTSVSVWATRKRENGGRSRRVFRAAKDTDKMTKGATILNIRRDAMRKGLNIGTRR